MKSKIAKFQLHQKFQSGDKILEVEGFYQSPKDGKISYYIKGKVGLVSEESLSKLKLVSEK